MSVIVQAGEPHVARAVGEVAARLDATDVRLGAGAVPHATQDGSLSTGAPSLGRMFFKARPLSDLLDEWLAESDVAWDRVAGKPSSYPPSAHTHNWLDVRNAPWLLHETEPAFTDWLGDDLRTRLVGFGVRGVTTGGGYDAGGITLGDGGYIGDILIAGDALVDGETYLGSLQVEGGADIGGNGWWHGKVQVDGGLLSVRGIHSEQDVYAWGGALWAGHTEYGDLWKNKSAAYGREDITVYDGEIETAVLTLPRESGTLALSSQAGAFARWLGNPGGSVEFGQRQVLVGGGQEEIQLGTFDVDDPQHAFHNGWIRAARVEAETVKTTKPSEFPCVKVSGGFSNGGVTISPEPAGGYSRAGMVWAAGAFTVGADPGGWTELADGCVNMGGAAHPGSIRLTFPNQSGTFALVSQFETLSARIEKLESNVALLKAAVESAGGTIAGWRE